MKMVSKEAEKYVELFKHRFVFHNSDTDADELKSGWGKGLKDIFSDFEYEIRDDLVKKVKEIIKYGG